MLRRFSQFIVLALAGALVPVGGARASETPSAQGRARVFIHAFKTAESLALPDKRLPDADFRSVALGRSYLTSRLVGKVRRGPLSFAVVDDEATATHDLAPVVSFLRSRENSFDAKTYGVETKTTKWSLDVILTLKDRASGEIVWAKTVSGTCDEQRPISASQFDNNIFHTLMISAVEEAADRLLNALSPRGEATPTATAGAGAEPVGAGTSADAMASRAGAGEAARPSLAILRPDFRDGVTENEAVMLWGCLESCVDGAAFRVISRADVSRMMEEVALTTSSYLTDPSSREKARVGRLATVSKLLATSVGRVGEKYVMTFKVFDASTGEIDAARTDCVTADALGDLLPLVSAKVARVLRPAPSGTVLAPVAVRLAHPPQFLAGAFSARLETALARAGFAYKTGGDGARRLSPTLTAFSVRAVSDGEGFVYRGSVAFSLVLSDALGKPLAAPVCISLDDIALGRETGAAPSWLAKRYAEKLLDLAFARLSLEALK